MNNVEWFTIPNTEVKIPIIDIKGQRYMAVAQRLVWFNIEKQDWSIETEVEVDSADWVRFKCTIKDPSGTIKRTARKSKKVTMDKDFESCETGAIGRALALLGYGTAQAANDLEEGEVVDAPQSGLKQLTEEQIETGKEAVKKLSDSYWKPKTSEVLKAVKGSNGSYVVSFGKYKGQTLEIAGKQNLKSYISWLYNKAKEDGKDVSRNTLELEDAVNARWPEKGTGNPNDNEPPITDYEEPLPF